MQRDNLTQRAAVELVDALESTLLCEAPRAAAALVSMNAEVVPRAASRKAWALAGAYARRRLLLSPFRAQPAIRLHRAISELVTNLKPLGPEDIDIVDIGKDGEMYFLVFRVSQNGSVIGCLPHLHGMHINTEQWDQLWGGAG